MSQESVETKKEKRAVFLQRMKEGRERRKALEAELARLRAGQAEAPRPASPALQPTVAGEPGAANQPPAAPLPTAPQPKEQCVICGVEFYHAKLEEHMLRAHNEMPEVLRPEYRGELPPGTIVYPEGGGLPFKVRWTAEKLKYDCDHWDGNPDHMHWETIDPANLGLPSTTVNYQGVAYYLVAGQDNRVPNVIAGQLRQSSKDTRKVFAGASVGSVLPAPEEAEVS